MRVTLLIDSLGFGGAQRQIANLAVELKECGYEVNLIRYRMDDFYLSILQKGGIAPIFAGHKNVLVRALKISKAIDGTKPDVVISFMDASNFYASLASFGKKWKLIIGERITNPLRFTSCQGKVLKTVMKHRASAICCNSQSAADLWESFFPEVKEKLCTIYNIVDLPEAKAVPVSDGKIRFLVAARYEREKNLLGVIEAISTLSDAERNSLELHWFGKANIGSGKDSLLDTAKDAIEKNNLTEQIFLHPATDHIHDEMAKADFVSLFSFMEGLPNAILEGMALKKPIVMSKVSDYAVLVNEENGFLCDPADPADIAKAIRSALAITPEQRTKMGDRSYEKLLSICSKDAIVEKWIALLTKITEG